MTVSTSTNSVVYRGNGATTQFAVPFKVLDDSHLLVRRREYATGSSLHTFTGTDYTYAGVGDDSGTLTLAGPALADTYELLIERVVPYTQGLDVVNAGGFYPETVEVQLDLMEMQIQQAASKADRAIRVPPGDTVVDLAAAAGRAGMYLTFDAGGNLALSAGTGGDSAFRTDAAGGGGAALIGWKRTAVGASSRSLASYLENPVFAKDFGCVEDGVTDDSVNFNKAITACILVNPARPLAITGPINLASAAVIDRLVDTMLGEFRIIGLGPKAGFTSATPALTLFTSTFAVVAGQPQSERVTFENIRFFGPAGDIGLTIFSERFFRMKLINCTFHQIKCLASTTFAQHWSFERCSGVGSRGLFFSSQGAFYVNVHGCEFRDGTAGVFSLVHATYGTGVVGCSFEQNIFEGNAGVVVRVGQTEGFTFSGNYTEQNTGVVLNLNAGSTGGVNKGVVVTGNQLHPSVANEADVNYADIIWGQGGGFSAGNNSHGNMHDNADCKQYDLTSVEDHVTTGKKLFLQPRAQLDLLPDITSGYLAPITSNYVVVNPSNGVAAHTVALPPAKRGGKPITIFNKLSGPTLNFTVLPSTSADGSIFRGGAANGGLVQPPGSTRTYIPYADGTWDLAGTSYMQMTLAAATYAAAAGGATIDAQARASLAQLAVDVAALRTKLTDTGRA